MSSAEGRDCAVAHDWEVFGPGRALTILAAYWRELARASVKGSVVFADAVTVASGLEPVADLLRRWH